MAPSLEKIKVDVNKILGRGGYGKVFQGQWKSEQVAVKRIDLSKVVDQKQVEEQILAKLDHPNVIKLLHVESDMYFR